MQVKAEKVTTERNGTCTRIYMYVHVHVYTST